MSQKLVRIQQKKDSTADWNNSDLFLFDGEIGVDQTTGQIKIGKKISDEEFASWSDLNYITSASENAYKENCFSFGQNSIAGQKGYYIGAIDTLNKWIYLVEGTEKPISIPMGPNEVPKNGTLLPLNNTSFSGGDEFSIINGSYYYFCGKIEKFVDNNKIKYTVNLPFTTISYSTDFDDQVFFVTNKPYEGDINLIDNAMAIGQTTKANGKGSFACGRETMAAGGGAFAAGRKTKAGYIGTASGLNASAIGDCSFATNSSTTATGNSSAAFGAGTTSKGIASFSCGSNTTTEGTGAFSAGVNTSALVDASVALGKNTKAQGIGALACGVGTSAIAPYSFVANSENTAQGQSSAAFGIGTIANGAAAFSCGSGTIAGGENSVAFGTKTEASGNAAFASGDNTKAYGLYSFATNNYTNAQGISSAAFGFNTRAAGKNSFVTGISTVANGDTMTVGGKFNSTLDNKIVVYGNGKNNANRSDAYTLDWDGNAYYAGIIETLGIKLPTYNITLSSNNINFFTDSNDTTYYYYDLTGIKDFNEDFLNPEYYNLIINLKSLDITSNTSIDDYIEMKKQYEYAELIGATYDNKNIILISGDKPTQDIDIEVTVIKIKK